ncbi:MAG: outer membrane protein assembly factor BamA [Balneolaceae bacterium]
MFTHKQFFCGLLLIVFGFGFTGLGFAQDTGYIKIEDPTRTSPKQYEIKDIIVRGIQTARESYLISSSGLQIGRTITIPGDEISTAVRQLHRTGLFSDVEISYEEVPGGANIILTVKEQPRLEQYVLEGIKRSQRKDLREKINLLRGFAVTNSVRSQAISTIKRYYLEKGYWRTKIDVKEEISDDERNRVTLTFNIDPGERIKVRHIRFEGNEDFSDKKLRKEFSEIKQDRWWRIFKKHLFVREDFDEGKDNLVKFYRDQGYLDMRIIEDTVFIDDWRRNKEGIAIDFEIYEGPQYKVRNVTWEGNTVYTDEQLSSALGFQQGDVFNESRFEENVNFRQDNNDISSLYQNIGYLFSQIIPEIKVVAEDSIDIHFEIFEDEIATIRDVSFTGNTKTHDDVVRRTLRTAPGQTYSRAAIVRTLRELGQLGYFSPENIQPDLNPDQEEKTVDVIYRLQESESSDNFEFSGGFGGRQVGLILAARVNFNNFSVQRMFEPGGWNPIPSGDGQRLSLGVQITGSGFQSYNLGFTEPWLGGKPRSLGVNFSYDLLNFRSSPFSTDRRRNELFSASVSLGQQLKWPDDFFITRTILNYQLIDSRGFAQVFSDGRANILSLTQVLERNSTDNPISPRTGSKFSISGEFGAPLPGFEQFFKIRTDYQHHSTITGKLVLTSSASYGYLGHFLSANRSNFQRFFIGGTPIQQRQNFLNDNIDMRGFPGGFNGVISPLDGNRNLIGGRVFSKYSFELRYPAVSSDQLQLIPYTFVDAGNTFLSFDRFDPFNLKRAAGFGARVFLPILGLVDISYGYRFDGTPSSTEGSGLEAGKWEFLFNIGAPF